MKTSPTSTRSSLKPTARRLAGAAMLVAFAFVAAGCGADSGTAPKADASPDATATGPSKIGRNGPEAGDCLADLDTSTDVIDTTVPCETEHAVEVTQVITAPANLDPEVEADRSKIGKLASTQCDDARDYIGYTGDLTGALYDGWVTAGTDARKAGARWIACAVGFYDAGKPGSAYRYDLAVRDSPIKGTITTDADFLDFGTQCLKRPKPGGTFVCDPDSGRPQYLGLANRPDEVPFISRAHQVKTSREFCTRVAPAYARTQDPERWVFFSEAADEYYGQNCVIPLKDFTGPRS